ncbi:hypothetical protein BU14_0374s0019 [Porphyra umbilicalis]|uniref:N-acetyltransferase domain-containing protein n=1 Tax=Porphyra umbilicalis TaxID=2786 RepID=A0A1X6NX85_PORUM|nr:hypothetical protein BU14_0374s0019 [Porphyra umbilicalis]|eukprot:OSX73145.1 hypothetical protein BU14_0374s0019 [Porphyra umbilicalis]
MKDNADLVLVGPHLRLVPYRPEHVDVYHGWMQDAELLRLTASERLDRGAEVANQRSWAADAGKCTFIILDGADGSYAPTAPPMVGDVNFYLLPPEADTDSDAGDDDGGGGERRRPPPPPRTAEIEVMIAEPTARRRGLASAAVRLAAHYAATAVGVDALVAKVLADNAPSLRLFEGLGFVLVRRVAAFGEVHLRADAAAVGGVPRPPLRTLSYDAEVGRRRPGGGAGGGGELPPTAGDR